MKLLFMKDLTEIEKAELVKLLVDGLKTDGEHHKQWYLEEALKKIGFPVEELKEYGVEAWTEGRAP